VAQFHPDRAATPVNKPRVAFVVRTLWPTGGTKVVVEHACNLNKHHGFEVSIVELEPDTDPSKVPVDVHDVTLLDGAGASAAQFDLAIATFWDTAPALWDVPADRHAYFVQSLEDRFYREGEVEQLLAQLTYRLNLPVLTEAHWIAATLRQTVSASEPFVIRNGVDKNVFGPIPSEPPQHDGPLRILIDAAGAWYKDLPATLEALEHVESQVVVSAISPTGTLDKSLRGLVDVVHPPMSQAELRSVYLDSDVMLKTSRVEGMYGPPIEAFHSGCTLVTTPVTGHEEFAEHGLNAWVVDWDDPGGTARALDLLANDAALLTSLRTQALETARNWPSWEQSSSEMATAVESILDSDQRWTFHELRPLHNWTSYSLESQSNAIHQLKTKVEADAKHISKLDQLLVAAEANVQRSSQMLSDAQLEVDSLQKEHERQLAGIRADLAHLRKSRWIRWLSVAEKPARRIRPGLGSISERLQGVERRAE